MRIFLYSLLLTLSQIESDKVDIQKIDLVLPEESLSLISCDDLNALIHKILLM